MLRKAKIQRDKIRLETIFKIQVIPSTSQQNSSVWLYTPHCSTSWHFRLGAVDVSVLIASPKFQSVAAQSSRSSCILRQSSRQKSWSGAHNNCGERVLKFIILITKKSKWVDKLMVFLSINTGDPKKFRPPVLKDH